MPFEIAYFIISVVTLMIVGYLFYGKYLFKRKKDNKRDMDNEEYTIF